MDSLEIKSKAFPMPSGYILRASLPVLAKNRFIFGLAPTVLGLILLGYGITEDIAGVNIAGIVIFFIAPIVFAILFVRSRMHPDKIVDTFEYDIDHEFIRWKTLNGDEGEEFWATYVYVEDKPDVYVLLQNGLNSLVLPKAAFDVPQLTRLSAFMRSKGILA
jgi:hypothetical protein